MMSAHLFSTRSAWSLLLSLRPGVSIVRALAWQSGLSSGPETASSSASFNRSPENDGSKLSAQLLAHSVGDARPESRDEPPGPLRSRTSLMTTSYGIDSVDYLRRARARLDEGTCEGLFYAAFELRSGTEARLQEYLDAREDVAKHKKKGWKI